MLISAQMIRDASVYAGGLIGSLSASAGTLDVENASVTGTSSPTDFDIGIGVRTSGDMTGSIYTGGLLGWLGGPGRVHLRNADSAMRSLVLNTCLGGGLENTCSSDASVYASVYTGDIYTGGCLALCLQALMS